MTPEEWAALAARVCARQAPSSRLAGGSDPAPAVIPQPPRESTEKQLHRRVQVRPGHEPRQEQDTLMAASPARRTARPVATTWAGAMAAASAGCCVPLGSVWRATSAASAVRPRRPDRRAVLWLVADGHAGGPRGDVPRAVGCTGLVNAGRAGSGRGGSASRCERRVVRRAGVGRGRGCA